MPVRHPPVLDVQACLDSDAMPGTLVEYRRSQVIFSQGDPGESVMYIVSGVVRLSVRSTTGKEAVVAMLGRGDFLGEGALAGRPLRLGRASAIEPTTLRVIPRRDMMRLLHEEHAMSDRFIEYLVGRNRRIEADLIDQLFNSAEKRLARVLLLMARYGRNEDPHQVVPKISQEVLAEMVGTTRSRVNFFMNKFRKLGFIDYNGVLKVHDSLLSVVLHD